MSEGKDLLEIKFRLHDGSDIGPKRYPAITSVATLKQSIFAEWPKGKKDAPRTVSDLKLINAGMILDNHKTLGECHSPLVDLCSEVTTMHIVVRPPSAQMGASKKATQKSEEYRCGCAIL